MASDYSGYTREDLIDLLEQAEKEIQELIDYIHELEKELNEKAME